MAQSDIVELLNKVIELDETTNISGLELVYTVAPMPPDADDDDVSENRYAAIGYINNVCMDQGMAGIQSLSNKMGSFDKANILILAYEKAQADDVPIGA